MTLSCTVSLWVSHHASVDVSSLLTPSFAHPCHNSVLHPSYKLEYFEQQRWQREWILTARELMRDEFDLHYANLPIPVDPLLSSSSDSNAAESGPPEVCTYLCPALSWFLKQTPCSTTTCSRSCSSGAGTQVPARICATSSIVTSPPRRSRSPTRFNGGRTGARHTLVYRAWL